MSADTKKETMGFQAEIQQLLDLMIHSLYGNREIFLRELISNASDAADKLRFEALGDQSLFEDEPELKIHVEYNKDQKTISVYDNGIGMSREEVISHLGTIAKSGTREFFKSLTGDQARDSRLIGQFGVGFYSAFIVADRVEVVSRRAGLPRGEGVRWISEGKNEYTVETVDRPKRGTRVTLHMRDEAAEFLDGYRLRSITRKYSDHISIPIVMPAEGKDSKGEDVINSATALWTRPKKDIKDEEYHEFYKHVGHDFENPLAWTHNKVEGKTEYTSLLFIPSRAPFDLWDRERRHGVKLYVRKVFIMDDAEQLIPAYLRFVRGIVDSDDLPLNISREILQHNKTIESIRSGCTRKVLDLLKSMADEDPEKYAGFWSQFGRLLKEGIVEDSERKEDLARLLRFASTHEDTEKQQVSLMAYKERMKEGQKAIYYVAAENYKTARNSPHLEIFRKKGIEVLLLTDPIDEWLTSHLSEFDGQPLQSVAKGELDLEGIKAAENEETDKKDRKKATKEFKGLLKSLEEALKDKVKEVRTTDRLTESPACLVAGDNDMGRHLQQILKAAGQSITAVKPVLEVNIAHPILQRLLEEQENETRIDNWAHILFDSALLCEGGQLDDPAGFVRRVNAMFIELPAEGPAKP